MRKHTLASLVAFLLTTGSAFANPWATYDWSTNSFQGGHPQTNRAPAYPGEYPAGPGAASIAPVNHCNTCPTGVGPAVPQPTYVPAPTYGAPTLNPAYVSNDVCYGGCGTESYIPAPSRTYTVAGFAEALFLNRNNDFSNTRNIVSGPNNIGFGDVLGNDDTGGWRIGADLLFGNPCSDWSHGVGFVYGDYGSFRNSGSGEFDLGISFDATTKNVPGFVNNSCYFFDQNTFFASMARVASSNSDQTNEQEELEGLGPDPLPGSGSENFPLPTYRADYDSDIDSVGIDFVLARRSRRLRIGIGWRQWNISEQSFVGITGQLHATDLAFANTGVAAPGAVNNGLEHLAFVYDAQNNGADAGFTYTGPVGAEDGIDSANFDVNGANDGVGPDTIELLSSQQATNTLNGLDLNVRGQIFARGRFDLVCSANIGVYINEASGVVAERVTEITGNGSVYSRGFSDSDEVISLIGGIGLDAGYWIKPSVRVYAGYQTVFINGVALSPEQETGMINNYYRLQHNGDIALHGAKLGLEFLY